MTWSYWIGVAVSGGGGGDFDARRMAAACPKECARYSCGSRRPTRPSSRRGIAAVSCTDNNTYSSSCLGLK